MWKEKSLKIRADLITKKTIWEMGDVRSIPNGKVREVLYDWDKAELFTILIDKQERHYSRTGIDLLFVFPPLDEYWLLAPLNEEEMEISDDMTEEEIKELKYELYKKYFYKSFDFGDLWYEKIGEIPNPQEENTMFFPFDDDEWVNLEKVERIVIEGNGGVYRVSLWLDGGRYMYRSFGEYVDADKFVKRILEFASKNKGR
jgi:hypothetical protein